MQNVTKLFLLLSLAMFSGCSAKEPAAPKKTAAELDTEISKIQNDQTMPQQAKMSVLTHLQKERDSKANGSDTSK